MSLIKRRNNKGPRTDPLSTSIYNDYPQDPTMDIAWVVGLA